MFGAELVIPELPEPAPIDSGHLNNGSTGLQPDGGLERRTLFRPNFNVAPSTSILVVARGSDGVRKLGHMTWGLVPSWAKERRGSGHVNARAETVSEKPSFRPSIAQKRCLIPMDGYYEWRTVEDVNAPLQPSGKSPKRAVYVTRTDGQPMAVAGLWSTWRSPDNGPTIRTCCVITTAANESLATVHDRMPVVVEANDWSVWLGDVTKADGEPLGAALDLLLPAENATLTMFDVGPLVNSVRNNGPELIQRVRHP